VLVRRAYEASAGTEHFISIEAEDRHTLLGFVRLRLPPLQQPAPPPARTEAGDPADIADEAEVEAKDNAVVGGRKGGGGDGAVVFGGKGGGGSLLDEVEEEVFDLEQPFAELRGAALIRELHVYGQLIATADKRGADAQHTGLGRRLMGEAEATARAHGFRRVAVIAGIGSRGYYRKLGYELEPGGGGFMMKTLDFFSPGWRHACAPPVELLRVLGMALAMFALLLLLSLVGCGGGDGGLGAVVRCSALMLV